MREEFLIFLVYVESVLDRYNGEYGTKDSLCMFCHATKYDSVVGILHNELCIIKQIRDKIIGWRKIE